MIRKTGRSEAEARAREAERRARQSERLADELQGVRGQPRDRRRPLPGEAQILGDDAAVGPRQHALLARIAQPRVGLRQELAVVGRCLYSGGFRRSGAGSPGRGSRSGRGH